MLKYAHYHQNCEEDKGPPQQLNKDQEKLESKSLDEGKNLKTLIIKDLHSKQILSKGEHLILFSKKNISNYQRRQYLV